MPTSSKDPDKAAGGDSVEQTQLERDEDLTKELNALFAELRQTCPLDMRNPFDFGRFCQGQRHDVTELPEQFKAHGPDQHRNLTDLAEQFKVKGNQFFKEGKYRGAVQAYTQGLKMRCSDKKLNSILHANRAAAFKHLDELQLAFRDCVYAITLNCTNYKAAFRGADCLVELSGYNRCEEWGYWIRRQHEECGIQSDDADFAAFWNKYEDYIGGMVKQIMDYAQKRGLLDSMNPNFQGTKRLLLAAFKERGYRFDPPLDLDNTNDPNFSSIYLGHPFALTEYELRVYADPENNSHLIWPAIMLVYTHPVAGAFRMPFTSCMEMSTLGQLFEQHFARPFSWDTANEYRTGNMIYRMPLGNLNAAFPRKYTTVPPTMTLRDALATPGHVVVNGLPMILATTKQQTEEDVAKLPDLVKKMKL